MIRHFQGIPPYPDPLRLISAPFNLALINSGFIGYQIISCASALPPWQESKLTFKLIPLSWAQFLISKGVQKYLIKRLTFSHEPGATLRKSNLQNSKHTEQKNYVVILRTFTDL